MTSNCEAFRKTSSISRTCWGSVSRQAGSRQRARSQGATSVAMVLESPLAKRVTSLSVAAKKGTKMAAKWSPARGAVGSEPFPLLRGRCPERPGAVKGAPLLGAAERTLDSEDRSEMIAEEGKAGRKLGERWSAILVPSPAASNNLRESTFFQDFHRLDSPRSLHQSRRLFHSGRRWEPTTAGDWSTVVGVGLAPPRWFAAASVAGLPMPDFPGQTGDGGCGE